MPKGAADVKPVLFSIVEDESAMHVDEAKVMKVFFGQVILAQLRQDFF